MTHAIALAKNATIEQEVPIGAIIVKDNKIIAEAHNLVRLHCDPTAHAEILVIRQAALLLGSFYLDNCDLYVTLEPCAMCASAISWARLRRVYFGAYDPKGGGVEHGSQVYKHSFHRPEVIGGVNEQECGELLTAFFKEKR